MTSALVSYAPSSLAELEDWAKRYANSGLFGKAYQGKPMDAVLAIMWGQELGLPPISALNSIAIINGRPALWGDHVAGLAERNGKIVSRREGFAGKPFDDNFTAWCECTVPNGDTFRAEYSVADAKLAKLWNKRGHNGQDTPWVTHPKRMLQMRARQFCIRDAAPDLGLGPSAEEMREVEDDDSRAGRARDVSPPRQHEDGRPYTPYEEVDAANAEAAEPERVARAEGELARDPLGINGSPRKEALAALKAGLANARTAADAQTIADAYAEKIRALGTEAQLVLSAILVERIENEAENRRAREAFKEGAARGAAYEASGGREDFGSLLEEEGDIIGPDE